MSSIILPESASSRQTLSSKGGTPSRQCALRHYVWLCWNDVIAECSQLYRMTQDISPCLPIVPSFSRNCVMHVPLTKSIAQNAKLLLSQAFSFYSLQSCGIKGENVIIWTAFVRSLSFPTVKLEPKSPSKMPRYHLLPPYPLYIHSSLSNRSALMRTFYAVLSSGFRARLGTSKGPVRGAKAVTGRTWLRCNGNWIR